MARSHYCCVSTSCLETYVYKDDNENNHANETKMPNIMAIETGKAFIEQGGPVRLASALLDAANLI